MVSTATMGIAELAAFLVANGSYASVAEAMAALNIVITEGVGATGTALAVSGGAAEAVIGTVGQTALEVAAQAELAATGTNVTTAGIGLLQGSGTTGAAAILGVDMGIVAACAAPLLGVSLGVGWYASNPEFWTKLSQRLLPFCYPETTKIPTWAEVGQTAWETSIAKSIIDAIKELFQEEGIPIAGEPSGGYVYDGIEVTPYNQPIVTATEYHYKKRIGGNVHTYDIQFSKPVILYKYGTTLGYFFYSKVQNDTCIMTVTHNGEPIQSTLTAGGNPVYVYDDKPAYGSGGTESISSVYDLTGTFNESSTSGSSSTSVYKMAWIALYGNYIAPGQYVEGTSEWTGNVPTEIPEAKPAVIGIDSTTGNPITQPMVPISFPLEFPDTPAQPEVKPDNWPPELPSPVKIGSPDPEVQPDPDKTTDPEKQVKPYIQPLPIPWETTFPDTDSDTLPYPPLDPTVPRPPIQTIEQPPIELGPDPIGISPWPAMPSTPSAFPTDGSAGLITVYNPTPAELYAFESWLWVTLSQASIDTVWNNPFDGVICLFELYCDPTINGRRNIHSGFLDSGVPADTVSRYTYIDCGTLGIPEYYGNYLDYSPYSKAHVYLPFIGIQELNVDDIVGHAVNITYRIDEYNGSCIAMITVAKVTTVNGEQVEYSNTMYQFSGNCAVELPISGGNQSSILAGMMTANAYQQAANISAGAQLVGGIASTLGGVLSLAAGGMGVGGIGSGISDIIGAAGTQAYGQANALSHMLSGKSTVQKSGQFGSSHGALGIKIPFITVTRPKQIQVPNYEDLYGFPAHKMVTIGSCQGFLRCREVHVVSATATNEEKALIEQMLKSGVYVTE